MGDGFLPKQQGFEGWSGAFTTYDANPLLFLSRAVSHICAPGFFYTMGIGMVFFSLSRRAKGWSNARLAWHHVVRGFLLLLVGRLVNLFGSEPSWATTLEPQNATPNANPQRSDTTLHGIFFGFFQVMTALGMVMMVTGCLMPLLCWLHDVFAWDLCGSLTPASFDVGHKESGSTNGRKARIASVNSPVDQTAIIHHRASLSAVSADTGALSTPVTSSAPVSEVLSSFFRGSGGELLALALGLVCLAVESALIVGNQDAANLANALPWPRFGAAAESPVQILLRFLVFPGTYVWGFIVYPLLGWLPITMFGVAAGFCFSTAGTRSAPAETVSAGSLSVPFLSIHSGAASENGGPSAASLTTSSVSTSSTSSSSTASSGSSPAQLSLMRHGIKAIVLLVLFFALRAPIEVAASGSVQSSAQYFLSLVNYRGYPRGEDGGNSLIAFFNVCKYPPSPAYQLITLGTVSAILFLFAAFPFGLALVASMSASAAAAASASLTPSHGAASDSADVQRRASRKVRRITMRQKMSVMNAMTPAPRRLV